MRGVVSGSDEALSRALASELAFMSGEPGRRAETVEDERSDPCSKIRWPSGMVAKQPRGSVPLMRLSYG